jgi:hypothetical protein
MDDALAGFGLPFELGVGVGHRDRAREPSVRRACDGVPLRLFDGQPQCRHERLASLGIRQHDERRVGIFECPGCLEGAGEHLVEVDRSGELPEDPAPPAFLLRPLECPGQLAAELVHPGVEACNDLRHPFIGRVVRAPADNEQGQEKHYESAKAHADPDQNGGHSFAAGRKKPAGSQ